MFIDTGQPGDRFQNRYRRTFLGAQPVLGARLHVDSVVGPLLVRYPHVQKPLLGGQDLNFLVS